MIYLGLKISAVGLQQVEEKINAVKKASAPPEGKWILVLPRHGPMLSFLPGLATTLAPFHKLLQKKVPWDWTKKYHTAFEGCKESLTSDLLLLQYDLNGELRLAYDA